MSRWRGLGIGSLVVLAVGVGWWFERRRATLPPQIRIDRVVTDLGQELSQATILAQPSDGAVHRGWLSAKPVADDHGDNPGDSRAAVVAPPPSSLRYRVRVPPDGVLAVSIGVAFNGEAGPHPAGIRFAVTVDGHERFARVLNPAVTAHDDRWRDARIDLAAEAGRDVDVVLSTTAVGTGPLVGTPGWTDVRLLRPDWRVRQRASAAAPSVLVLLVDTLRFDHLGYAGASPSPSPTLDTLGARGTLFTQAIAQAPWTMPSVATLFTGLHPEGHGLVGGSWKAERAQGGDATRYHLQERVPTLASLSQEAGITTVGVTANGLISPGTGLARGFEDWTELTGNATRSRFARAEHVNRRFLEWAGHNRGVRFFGYLHYMDTHGPYQPPPPFLPPPAAGVAPAVARGEIDRMGRDHVHLAATEVAHLRALYDGAIRYWDDQLATLLEGLARLGLAESTVVVVVADHGDAHQEHGYLGHCVHLHDELLRVPLVMAGPRVARGRRVTQVAQGIDFLPTVGSLLDVGLPAGLPGRDLAAENASAPTTAVSSTWLWVAPDGSRDRLLAIRRDRWKLIHAPGHGHSELYDLAQDPGEQRNRFGEVPEGAELMSALGQWLAARPTLVAAPVQDPALRGKLTALGYLD